MSSFDRRAFVVSLVALLGVSACGFEPVLAPEGGAGALQNAVRATDPVERNGFDFVGRIEDRLGRPLSPRFGLEYTLITESDALAITSEQEINRYNVTGTASYTLRDLETGEALTRGKVNSFTSYSAAGSTVATLTGERDANRRLMVILADRVVTELLAQVRGAP